MPIKEKVMHVYSRDGDVYYGNVIIRDLPCMGEEEYDDFIKETLEKHFPNLRGISIA